MQIVFYSFLFYLSLLFLFPNVFLKFVFSFFLLVRFLLIWDFLPADIRLKLFKFQTRCLNKKIVNLFQVTRCKSRTCKCCAVSNTWLCHLPFLLHPMNEQLSFINGRWVFSKQLLRYPSANEIENVITENYACSGSPERIIP